MWASVVSSWLCVDSKVHAWLLFPRYLLYLHESAEQPFVELYLLKGSFPACVWGQSCSQLRRDRQLKAKGSASSATLSLRGPQGAHSPTASVLRVPSMPSDWIMPPSGIISCCWAIQTFVFITARSQKSLNDRPGLINMRMKTMCDEL